MKKALKFLAVLTTSACIATAAHADFYGGWTYDNARYGSESLILGDSSDDSGLYMSGTDRYCGRPGLSYSQMRRALDREGGWVNWRIADTCNDAYGSFVRVCFASRGRNYCSTYREHGWDDFDNP